MITIRWGGRLELENWSASVDQDIRVSPLMLGSRRRQRWGVGTTTAETVQRAHLHPQE